MIIVKQDVNVFIDRTVGGTFKWREEEGLRSSLWKGGLPSGTPPGVFLTIKKTVNFWKK